jgi:dihydroneopterin aldolase
MSSFTIQLHGLRFFAAHGLYAEEALAENEFEVHISLVMKAPKTTVLRLEETINYAEVYRITKEIFSVRKDLLETLAMEIAEELKRQFPAIKKASIQVRKLHPPIASFTGSVSVTYQKKFKD